MCAAEGSAGPRRAANWAWGTCKIVRSRVVRTRVPRRAAAGRAVLRRGRYVSLWAADAPAAVRWARRAADGMWGTGKESGIN